MRIAKGLHGWEVWEDGKLLCTLTLRALVEFVRGVSAAGGDGLSISAHDLVILIEEAPHAD